MQNYRWSVRGLDPTVLDMLKEVRQTSGFGYGQLVSEAIADWYENLPEEDAPIETPLESEVHSWRDIG